MITFDYEVLSNIISSFIIIRNYPGRKMSTGNTVDTANKLPKNFPKYIRLAETAD